MEPQPGSPAYYETFAAAAPAAPPRHNVAGGPPAIPKLPLPPEAVESNANRNYREKKTSIFRQLNSSINNPYLRAFQRKAGANWKTVRNRMKKQFQNELAAKEAVRREALKRHKNAEWAAYLVEHRRWRNSLPKGPGIPTMGDPVRLLGGKTRKHSSKKKNGSHAKTLFKRKMRS